LLTNDFEKIIIAALLRDKIALFLLFTNHPYLLPALADVTPVQANSVNSDTAENDIVTSRDSCITSQLRSQ